MFVADELEAREVFRRPVMHIKKAMLYVGKNSERAFRDWCKRYRVNKCSSARYARADLEAGMRREARGSRIIS